MQMIRKRRTQPNAAAAYRYNPSHRPGVLSRGVQPSVVIIMDTVVISALDQEGRGVARVEGKAVFVEGALIGERVAIEITRSKPSYALARMTELVAASHERV